jgi:2'-5' RNA ligase
MRLFTAVDLAPEIVARIEALLRRLKPTACIQWSPPSKLHITTKFIGEFAAERLPELERALSHLPSRDPIEIHIRRVGFFPNPHSPRVFWCGVDAPQLGALAAETEAVTSALGVPRESRAFSPHLTLARIRERTALQPLREAIASLGPPDLGSFQASSFFLYQSTLKPGGSVYTKLAEFPLLRT